jgi:uncharacterized membrane protein
VHQRKEEIETVWLLLYLHILTMFAAVAMAAGSSILVLLADRRGDRRLVASITGLPLDRVIPPLYISGGLFGILTAVAFGYSLVTAWLLIAYTLFAALMLLGIVYSGPLMGRVHAIASDQEADPHAFAEVMQRFRLDTAVSLAGIALIVADMVFKPFL